MNIKHLAGILMAAAMIAVAGCGNSTEAKQEKAAKVYLEELTDIADAVEAVKSEKTAKKAAKVIATSSKKLEKMTKSLEDLTPMQRAAIFMGNSKDFMEQQQRLAIAMQKIAMENPEYIEIIQEEMQKMPRLQ